MSDDKRNVIMRSDTFDVGPIMGPIRILGSGLASALLTHFRSLSDELRELERQEMVKATEALERVSRETEYFFDREANDELAKYFRAALKILEKN